MNNLPIPKPLVVAVLDGWGISFLEQGNAIAAATTPTIDSLAETYPTAALYAASTEVGLPWGEVGNSETGHSNIGAGTVSYQALPMIDQAIVDGTFFTNQVFQDAISHARIHNSNIHLMGLLGPGGVHAHSNHLLALIDLLAKTELKNRTYIHLFTDGRDTPLQSAAQYLTELENHMQLKETGTIASVTGRLYAMDRNKNWERTKKTYDMLTGGPREAGASSAMQAIENAYQQNLTDETIEPTSITSGGGPIATVQANDAAIFFNYRPDRARQLTSAFTEVEFPCFARALPANLFFATMTHYDDAKAVPAAFTEDPLEYPLARILSEAGLKQLHIAETEKYAHVTYYLNGGNEQPYPGEIHELVPSSKTKDFATEPGMAAKEITDKLMTALKDNTYDVIFVNYANADMVGHTGNFDAAVQACSLLDQQIARLQEAVLAKGGALLITADHGNAEEMVNPSTGEVTTDHSSNPVPVFYVREELRRTSPRSVNELVDIYSEPIGMLADVAPTILEILNLEKNSTMTGISLLDSL